MNCIKRSINCSLFRYRFIIFERRYIYKLRNTVILFIVLLFVSCLQGQETDYLFTQVTPKEGLASITPNYIQQDTRGYIWVGGNNVLQRYDGHRFQNFFIGKGKAIPGSILLGIQIDQKNRIWLLTGNNHLGYLDADKLTYHPVKINTPAGFENSFVALQVNNQGGLILIYVGKGITTFNEAANEVSAKYNLFEIPKGWEPRHVVQDEEANYWICSTNGLLKYNSKKKLLSYRGHIEENDPVITRFANRKQSSFIYTLKNISWILLDADKPEIYSIDRTTGEIKEWFQILNKALKGQYHTTWGVQLFGDGSTWLTGAGLFAQVNYEKHSLTIIKKDASGANSIRYDDVYNMFQDNERNNWVCTNKGLFRFNPSAHIFYSIKNITASEGRPYQHVVTDILETRDGELLVSTWGAGVFCYNKEMKPIASKSIKRIGLAANGMIWSLMQTQNGDIWLGLQNGMVGVYQAEIKKMTWHKPNTLGEGTIRQIVEDQNGNVWLGTQDGHLIKWDRVKKSFQLVKQMRRLISKLYVDKQNNIWAGTDNDGVYCINTQNGKTIHYYSETGEPGKTLLINGAADIIQYDDSTMIIAGSGLNFINTNTSAVSYLDEGTQISSLALDSKRNLWFTTNTSISCRNMKDEGILYAYNEHDGISNFSFQTAAAISMRNGSIAFGTNHDIQFFKPEKVLSIKIGRPAVQLSGLFLQDKRLQADSVMRTGKMSLRHNQNSITFQFTNNQFQTLQAIFYKVEGIDKKWKPLQEDGELELNYLAPGNYVVKATCVDENRNLGAITMIEVNIAAPFYKQWWFYSAIALIFVGFIIWIDRERMKRKEAVQNMRSNIAGKLHEDVNVALNNINILSEMAKLKADSEPIKSKEFIEQINNKSQHMIRAMDDMLWSIAPENDSMQKTIDRMQEFIEAQMNRYAIKIELTVDERVKKLNLPMQLRHEAFSLFTNSLTGLLNAQVGYIGIQLAKEKNLLLYIMKFDTHRCDTEQLNHFVHNREMALKMDEIKAKWEVHYYKNHALVECRIPMQDE